MHQLFEEQAAATPDAVAIVAGRQQLTYAELNMRANRLARALRERGVGRETPVAVRLPRSVEFVVSVLGILKAGGAYVPLALDCPLDRQRFVLDDSGAPVLLSMCPLPPPLCGPHVTLLDAAAITPCSAPGPSENPDVACAADDLAYIMYTSGSTGRPKGVAVPHRAVVRLVRAQDYADFRASQRFLFLASPAFDASTFELWGPLLNGGTCVLAPPETPDFHTLEQLIRDQHVTCLWLTAGLFHQIVDQRPSVLETVSHVLTGGDVVSVAHVRRACTLLPHVRLTNGYGPTEATTFTCTYEIDRRVGLPAHSVPIGRPIANTTCYILDADGEPTPIGVPGELCIGGDGLARCYVNLPELTAERFVPHPLSDDPGARLYRTGDIVRYLSDGTIEFLGRRDLQVKIRGFRIELEEIESVLSQHPDVADCAVVVQTDRAADKHLAAFVVLRSERALPLSELRAWLGRTLPDHMLPTHIRSLASLPLTPHGKVDRRALESQCDPDPPTDTSFQAPGTQLECQLAAIWQDILHLERVGVHDHFSDLGGHSLSALAVVSQITTRLGRSIPLSWIMQYPTIAELASRMESLGAQQHVAPAIPTVDRNRPVPMSHGQRRLWLLQHTLPEAATYNEPVVHRLLGPVDADRLRLCLRALLVRHEILRTALIAQGEQLLQQVLPSESVDVPWQTVDWRHLDSTERERALQEEVRRPFDLRHPPLWRAVWAAVDIDDHILALTFHHSLVDEWSLRILFRELAQLYAAGGDATAAGLEPLGTQYADFAMWQQDRIQGPLGESQRAYWRDQLTRLPPALTLPTDLPRPVHRHGRGGLHRFTLPQPLARMLRQLARREEASLFALLLTTFQVWLHRVTAEQDIVVGTPVSQRDRTELQSLVGFFLNTLPMRTRLTSTDSFRDVLARVRQTILSGLAHSDLPFDELVALAPRSGYAPDDPLYQVMFVLVEEDVGAWRLGPTRAERVPVHTLTSKNDLILSVTAEQDVWSCDLEYATDLFKPAGIERLATTWIELLRAITAQPCAHIGQLNLLSASQRHQVLVTWNETARDYPRDKCIHQLFEEQAALAPNAVAVVADDRTYTYRALDHAANRLAHVLRRLGVGRDTRVAVHLDRSAEFIISVLGILKAGGMYVPLARDYPLDRLRFMLMDSGATVVVTHGPLPDGLRRQGLTVVDLRQDAALNETLPGSAPDVPSAADDLAYVMYTSGSTGQPKGVAIPHRGVVRLVRGQDYAALDARQRFLFFSSPCFDASTFELWAPLLNGATCVVFCPALPDLETLEQYIRRQHITCMWLTAGLFHQIVDLRPSLLATVPHLLAGGDVLSAAHVRRALDLCPTLQITNGYGPTEGTTFTCTHAIDRRDLSDTGSVPIGRPIANTSCYILDQQGQPVPVGVSGELYIGGDGLAREYLNLPALTAERFVSHPFSAEPDARLYRTGDLARYRPDGTIEFLGRRDAQVKIRGFRVEPGEIESVLEKHPDVHACAVVAYQADGRDKELRACVVPRERAVLSAMELRGWLRERLPEHLQPSRFVVMDTLPLTANGKVDRRALEHLPGRDVAVGVERIPPHTDTECRLASIWQEVLGVSQVGIHDRFFDLGGQSLSAVRTVSRIHQETGVLLPLSRFFAQPTIAELARAVDEELQTRAAASVSAPPPAPLFLLGWYLNLESLDLVNQPHYVLPFPDFEVAREQCRVEYLAETCLHTLRSLRPHGPYRLAGYSLAGLVAYEMACRLSEEGEVVQMLGIVDTHPSTSLRRAAPLAIAALARPLRLSFRTQLTLARSWFYMLELADFAPHESPFHALRRMAGDVKRALRGAYRTFMLRGWQAAERLWPVSPKIGETCLRRGPRSGDLGHEQADSVTRGRPFGKFWAHRWAHAIYRPRPYQGVVTLFASHELARKITTPGRGWQRWAREVREYLIPGTHGSCVTYYRTELAARFKDCLADTDESMRMDHATPVPSVEGTGDNSLTSSAPPSS